MWTRRSLMTDKSTGEGALICIPTYNERENVEKIVPAVLDVLPFANVLVIDDNSPDGTGALGDALANRDDRVHVLHREMKEGLGKAYLAGFAWALEKDYKYVIEFDADFSHNPDYLPEMILLLETNDLVIGSRRVPGGGTEKWGVGRSFVSIAGSLYARAILGVGIRDLTGGFNGFRRKALESLQLDTIGTSGYGFQIEIKYRAVKSGLKVMEMPIIFRDREQGISKMSTRIFVEAMAQVIRLRFSSKR
jgi:dolichol-phosphate mannosyltransferase